MRVIGLPGATSWQSSVASSRIVNQATARRGAVYSPRAASSTCSILRRSSGSGTPVAETRRPAGWSTAPAKWASSLAAVRSGFASVRATAQSRCTTTFFHAEAAMQVALGGRPAVPAGRVASR